MNAAEFWEKHQEYMDSGMTFGEAFHQVEFDNLCEWHDNRIAEWEQPEDCLVNAFYNRKEEKKMDKYLVDEYNVYEDENYLTDENQIKDYFMDCGSDFFECGQGYYSDWEEVLCKIGEKFYQVKIEAEIGSAKQEYGDRLYWVDDIKLVTYKEVDKPQPKERTSVKYCLSLTQEQKRSLENFMKQNNISFS